MTTFSWYGYTVEVDEQATRDWYAQAEDWGCTCGHCWSFPITYYKMIKTVEMHISVRAL